MPRTFFRAASSSSVSRSAIALIGALFFGCADSTADLPPLPDSPTGSFLAIATSDISGGALHTVNLATLEVRKNIDTRLDSQPVVRAYGDKLYVLDQSHGAVRIYDLTNDFRDPSDYSIQKLPEVPA